MSNILVVGGSSGIGSSTAMRLAKSGHEVYLTYNTHPVNEDTGIHPLELDVKAEHFDFSALPECIDGVVYCPGKIDLLPFHRIQPENFIKDYELQVIGAIKVLQQVLERLKKSEKASVVLISTVAVQQGFNFHSMVSASKGALEGLTRALSAEWAPNIRVNAVAPSLTETPLASRLLNNDQKRQSNADRHPLKRIGAPEDIAEAICFLLSDKSSWMTGQVLKVDGGISSIRS